MFKHKFQGIDALGVVAWIWITVQWFNGRLGFVAFSAGGADDGRVLGMNILAVAAYTAATWFVYRVIKRYLTKKHG